MRAKPDDFYDKEFGEEQNYFISLTDLMTGVVFIFVILLAVYAMSFHSVQRELEKERGRAEKQQELRQKADRNAENLGQELKANRLKAEEAHQELEKEREKAETLDRELTGDRSKAEKIDLLATMLRQREDQRKTILVDLVARLNAQGVKAFLDAGNGIVRLPEELLFDSGQADLRPGGKQALQILAGILSEVLRDWCSADKEFRLEALFIEGHTDNVPIKNAHFADNWELSTSRAVSISRALKQFQPQVAEFKNPKGLPVLGVSGYGENRPVDDNFTEDGRRRNRRIDLRFLVAFPTLEQISEATGGLLSPKRSILPSSQKDANFNP